MKSLLEYQQSKYVVHRTAFTNNNKRTTMVIIPLDGCSYSTSPADYTGFSSTFKHSTVIQRQTKVHFDNNGFNTK